MVDNTKHATDDGNDAHTNNNNTTIIFILLVITYLAAKHFIFRLLFIFFQTFKLQAYPN